MKKVITVCLCLILALSAMSVACAEDFTIHAGTMFGDTIEQVKEKETLSYINEREYPNDKSRIQVEYEGTVAGYDDCRVSYLFDKEKGILNEVFYNMGGEASLGDNGVLKRSQELYDMLADKYGEPLSKDDEISYLMIGDRIYPQSEIYDYDYVGWSIQNDDYNIKIDLIITRQKNHNSGGIIYIDYHTYTDEDLEIAKKAYAEENQKKSDDL